MKYYRQFIRRYYLPLLALALIGLIYFGVGGVEAELGARQNQTTDTPKPSLTDLKIVAVSGSPAPMPRLESTEIETLSATPQVKNIAPSYPPQAKKITIKINDGRRAGNYQVDYQDGENAFALLQRITSNDIEYTDYGGDLGIFVDCIGGICRTAGYEYCWFFYVNAKLAQVGSSQYVVKPNDLIEWKYEEAY